MIIDSISKYHQLKKVLLERIASGQYPENSKIPSENELSEEFGISRYTVQRALGELINEKIVYREQGKGTFVRDVKRNISRRIAVLVYHIDNPFYSAIVSGIERYASERGFYTILCNTQGDVRKEDSYINDLLDQVDAFIMSPEILEAGYSKGFQKIIAENIPLVSFCRLHYSPLNERFSFVSSDNRHGGFLAGEHLVNCGYSNMFFISFGNKWRFDNIVKERLDGFKAALKKAGIKFDRSMIIEAPGTYAEKCFEIDCQSVARQIKQLSNGPVGIFAVSDVLALNLLDGFRRAGLRIPEDLGICGFDNIPEMHRMNVTTIEQQISKIGEMAAEVAVRQIGKRHLDTKDTYITLPVKLFGRGTTKKIIGRDGACLTISERI